MYFANYIDEKKRSSSLTQCKPCRYFRVSVRQFGWLLHALAPRLPMERSSDPSFDATSLTCQHHFGWFVQPLALWPPHNNSCFFCSVEICCRCKRLYWFNGVFKIKKLFTSQIHSRCVRTLRVSATVVGPTVENFASSRQSEQQAESNNGDVTFPLCSSAEVPWCAVLRLTTASLRVATRVCVVTHCHTLENKIHPCGTPCRLFVFVSFECWFEW